MREADETSRVFARVRTLDKPLPNGTVLKAEDFDSWSSAVELAKDLDRMRDELESERQRVLDESRAEGLRLGRQDALAEQVKAAEYIGQTITAWVNDAEPQLQQIVQRAFRGLLDLESDEKLLRSAVRKGLSTFSDAQTVSVRVSEADVEIAENALTEFAGPDCQCSVVSDPLFKSGDCVMETSMGVLDLRPDSLVAQLKSALAND